YREDKGSCVWRHFKLWLSKGNTTKIHHEVKCGANCVMYLYVSKSNVQIALLSTMSLNNKINTDFAPFDNPTCFKASYVNCTPLHIFYPQGTQERFLGPIAMILV
ncbi:21954_t:CDS:2, partial [Gigaspora rosea]